MARGEGRQKICEAAVRLFNDEGYDAVSLRQIAAEAGTTIGNLTYHFAHKGDLLIAILGNLHEGFTGRLDRTLSGQELMGHLMDLILANEENHRAYPFYFENLSQLMAAFPTLQEENDAFQRDILAYYVWAFEDLRSSGWLDATVGEREVQALAYAMVDMQASWVQASSPYRNGLLPTLRLSGTLALLIRHFVAAERREDYDALCTERGLL